MASVAQTTQGKKSFSKILSWKVRAKYPECEYMMVTPEMAQAMLSYNNVEGSPNRPCSERVTRKYAQLMKDGLWGAEGNGTSEPIIFSDAHRLLSGQHRLRAVIEAGVTQRFLIVFGEPDRNFSYIDQGRRRTGADIFSMYEVPNAALMSSAVRWVAAYEDETIGGGQNKTMSPEELYQAYRDNARLQESAHIGHMFHSEGLASPSTMTAMHYLCARKNRAQADDFFEKVGTGIGITGKRSPENYLRKKLIDNLASQAKLSPLMVAVITIKCWNAYRSDKKVTAVKWRTEQNPNEKFPKVL